MNLNYPISQTTPFSIAFQNNERRTKRSKVIAKFWEFGVPRCKFGKRMTELEVRTQKKTNLKGSESKPVAVWQLALWACWLVSSERPWQFLCALYSQFSEYKRQTNKESMKSDPTNVIWENPSSAQRCRLEFCHSFPLFFSSLNPKTVYDISM